jgi:para-nitrobenzyl esterase
VTDNGWLTRQRVVIPAEPGAARPVLVWIYGGANRFGDAADAAYDGSVFAREGNVVLVSLNHRVGVEGFRQIKAAPANRGLLDRLASGAIRVRTP